MHASASVIEAGQNLCAILVCEDLFILWFKQNLKNDKYLTNKLLY